MKLRRKSPGFVSSATPAIALGVVIGLPVIMPNHVRLNPAAIARQEAVAAAVAEAPYQVGRWLGRDIEVPRAAVELLKPNAILSRRFQRAEGGHSVSLLLVHCMDMRDMGGHYPPVCYPSSGWVPLDDPEADEAMLEFRGRPLPVRVYAFRRIEDGIREARIRIYNFFVMPDGKVTPDIAVVRGRSERLALSAQGVAQIQIITALEMPTAEAVAAANELLEGMGEILESLGIGARGERDAR